MPTSARALGGDLPIVDVLDDLVDAMDSRGRAVLHAPPGAGKTTIVPLALAERPWASGSILVLEPRRLAVRNAATRMASLLGESPGSTVGWRMRQDTRVGRSTRIEVVTEGVLTRRLQNDPALDGVSAVVFDEFHERSLDADLGLALCLEVVEALRDDLRLLVMSATLDAEPIAELLDAPVVRTAGRTTPVEIVHTSTTRIDRGRPATMEVPVAAAVRRALAIDDGDVLVFLPGAREIDRAQAALGDVPGHVDVRPLYGALSPEAQDAAISPSPPGRRKVVLSTSIAETSLTIEGVTSVVDAGWRRFPELDAATGTSRLVTRNVTRAEADQRAGRAGRLRPGRCERLWSAAEHATLAAHPEPEIAVADLTELALDLAAWGADVDDLAFLTPPPAGHLAAARALLLRLGALDEGAAITPHGRLLATLPLHPRLGHLVIEGRRLGAAGLAVEVAAALAEDGLARRGDTDLVGRLRRLRRPSGRDRAAADRARRDIRRIRRVLDEHGPSAADPASTERSAAGSSAVLDDGDGSIPALVALAHPDRIGQARPGQRGSFLLANGRGAVVGAGDPLAGADWVVVTDLSGPRDAARVREAVAIDEDDVLAVAGHRVEEHAFVGWDDGAGDVVARRVRMIDQLELSSSPIRDLDADLAVAALIDGLRARGLDMLPWTDDDRRLQHRLVFLHHLSPDRFPDVSDDALVDDEERLTGALAGCRRVRDLRRVDVGELLLSGLPWRDRAAIDDLAPERLPVPSGNRHRVDYANHPPVLAVKLQELFGASQTPTVGGGRVPVVLHLLSPAGRPLQVTQDLPSFWAGAYAQVRADMRGRYPKHPWPEDPTTATPTARTKRRS